MKLQKKRITLGCVITIITWMISTPLVFAGFDVERGESSVVRILSIELDASNEVKGVGTGSGFVASNGVVVTNCHVAGGAGMVFIIYKRGDQVEVHKGELMLTSPPHELDLAVLKVQFLNAPAVTLADGLPPKGEPVIALGYPGAADDEREEQAFAVALVKGFEQNPRANFITIPKSQSGIGAFVEASAQGGNVELVTEREWPQANSGFKLNIIRHNAPIKHGNSGGPLFNANGQVVGVNTQIDMKVKSDKDFAHALQQGGTMLASSSTELIRFLSANRISFSSSAIRNGEPSSPWFYVLIGLCVIATGTAIYLAAFKRQVVYQQIERMTQRRKPLMPQEVRASSQGKNDVRAPVRGAGQTVWIFKGKNTGTGAEFHFSIDAESAKRMGGAVYLGRSKRFCELHIESDTLSRQQVGFKVVNNSLVVEDRNATNPTRVNGRDLKPFEAKTLVHGDTLECGSVFGEIRMQR